MTGLLKRTPVQKNALIISKTDISQLAIYFSYYFWKSYGSFITWTNWRNIDNFLTQSVCRFTYNVSVLKQMILFTTWTYDLHIRSFRYFYLLFISLRCHSRSTYMTSTTQRPQKNWYHHLVISSMPQMLRNHEKSADIVRN